MQFWLNIADLVESCTTISAIVVGGVWAYLKFIRHRTGFPIIKPQLQSTSIRTDAGWIIRVDVAVENVGNTLARPGDAELRLRQIVPMPSDIESTVHDGYDPVDDSESQVMWPCLAQRFWTAEELGFEIEPDESGGLHADFFVPPEVKAIELYFFLANPKKSKEGIGWTKSIVVEL